MTLPSVYPVNVDADSPVLRGLTRLEIPDRNPLLPPLYAYNGDHPHHRLRPSNRRTYVYLVDPSPKGKEMAIKIANSMKVPSGPISGTYISFNLYRLLILHFLRASGSTTGPTW